MAYIGRQNLGGAYRQLDDISSGFDGSDTTHTMQVNSANVTVGDVNQIILSLGGVIQKPGTDFTVSGSVLTFTTAPAANTSFFAVLLGSDNGGTVTPTDGSVTSAKLAYPFVVNEDGASTDFRVESDTNSNMLLVDGSADEVMIGGTTSKSSAFSGSGKGLTVQAAVPVISLHDTDNTNYLSYFGHSGTAGYIGSAASGQTGQLYLQTSGNNAQVIDENGHITKPLQPAFQVKLASAQAISASTNTTLAFATEIFDQNADFASNTFTAPVTGRYLLTYGIYLLNVPTGTPLVQAEIKASNRDHYNAISPESHAAIQDYANLNQTTVMDMDANDTVYINIVYTGGSGVSLDVNTFFAGCLLA
jgi:hypothetical protein